MEGWMDPQMDGWMHGWKDGWVDVAFSHSDLSALETWTAHPGQDLVPSASSDTQCPPGSSLGWGWAKVPPLPAQAVHTLLACPQSCLFQLAAPVTVHLVSSWRLNEMEIHV